MALSPALISAGASLLSGLFGNSSAKKARARALEDEKQKFVRLREAAELGGFNPLTALQAAGAGFGANIPSGAPPLASIELVKNAITDFGSWATGAEAKEAARQELELDLAKIKLDQARHSASRAVAPQMPRLGRSGASSSTQAVSTPYGKFTIDKADSRTSIMAGGIRTNPHMGWDDTEEVEKRYGDVGGAVYGLAAAGADFYNTAIKPRYEAGKAAKEAEELRRNPLRLPPLNVRNFGIPKAYQPAPYQPTWTDYLRGSVRGYPALRSN